MTTNETWKPVKGLEGYYEVSDQGQVRSVAAAIVFLHRGRTVQRQRKVHVLKPQIILGRYPVVNLSVGVVRKTHYVYDLVLRAFTGPRPKNNWVCYANGLPHDVRLENLSWKRRGTRLTLLQVRAIRAAYKAGEKGTDLAVLYGVRPSHIYAIASGKAWGLSK